MKQKLINGELSSERLGGGHAEYCPWESGQRGLPTPNALNLGEPHNLRPAVILPIIFSDFEIFLLSVLSGGLNFFYPRASEISYSHGILKIWGWLLDWGLIPRISRLIRTVSIDGMQKSA